ncbi:unnamed protein product [Didymodactylos carnosus]|uniref:Uncharacterized protein n=1 Tax=Didymodactylos carnosus TaxID=1234261 RepID=A0A814JFK5_9BILA|nr:unnamed protein product [Didymodactylos carnosus]CAF1036778.1 unnamed protein product [Didymodactylos carnosus]CAF3558205.1 unnamed protein product [Didymodactylos carnosus]CAF3807306.1 unnamed protein product [Didymodactylos carnosus]
MIRSFWYCEERIKNGAKKLTKARGTSQQGRLDSFFTVSHVVSTTGTAKTKTTELGKKANNGVKRKSTASKSDSTDVKTKSTQRFKIEGLSRFITLILLLSIMIINETNVLRHELETLKPNRNVYTVQTGTNIFFKSNKNIALQSCLETLKSLQHELKECEKSSVVNDQA